MLAARIGKSGGALIQQMIVLVMGNIINGASVVAAIFFATIAVWIYGVRYPLFPPTYVCKYTFGCVCIYIVNIHVYTS